MENRIKDTTCNTLEDDLCFQVQKLESKLSSKPESVMHDANDINEETKFFLRQVDKNGNSLIAYAAYLSCPTVFDWLIKVGVGIESKNNDGRTALAELVLIKKLDEAKWLIDKGANVNARDKNERTILHYAAVYGDVSFIELLLKNFARVDARDIFDRTALSFAVHRKNVEIEFILRKYCPLLTNCFIPDNVTVKQFQRQVKSAIIKTGPLIAIDLFQSKPIVSAAIESQLHFENKTIQEIFRNQLQYIYETSAILTPLLNIIGLAALGYRFTNTLEKVKPFKIVVANQVSFPKFDVLERQLAEGGFFRGENTIFLSDNHLFMSDLLGTLLHESAHFVMKEVYKNECNPFLTEDELNKNEMKKIVANIADNFKNFSQKNLAEKHAYLSIESVFIGYSEKYHASELIAKVPEIMASIGIFAGYNWLKENVPELLDFYIKKVNVDFNNYAKLTDMEKHLQISGKLEPLDMKCKKWSADTKPEDKNLLLMELAKRGKREQLEKLLSREMDNLTTYNLGQALKIAVRQGHVSIGERLWRECSKKLLPISLLEEVRDIAKFMGNFPLCDHISAEIVRRYSVFLHPSIRKLDRKSPLAVTSFNTIDKLQEECTIYRTALVYSQQHDKLSHHQMKVLSSKIEILSELLTTLEGQEPIQAFVTKFNKAKSIFKQDMDPAAIRFLAMVGHVLASIFTVGRYYKRKQAESKVKYNTSKFWQSPERVESKRFIKAVKLYIPSKFGIKKLSPAA